MERIAIYKILSVLAHLLLGLILVFCCHNEILCSLHFLGGYYWKIKILVVFIYWSCIQWSSLSLTLVTTVFLLTLKFFGKKPHHSQIISFISLCFHFLISVFFCTSCIGQGHQHDGYDWWQNFLSQIFLEWKRFYFATYLTCFCHV